MKALLAGLTAIHSGKGVFAHQRRDHASRRAQRQRRRAVEELETEHPVICVHPRTGRPYVFVSSVLARFKGMTEAESKPIVDYLLASPAGPSSRAGCAGKQGTLTMWANPFVLHTAINDYSGYRRVTYRTTVEGHVPLAAADAGRREERPGGLTRLRVAQAMAPRAAARVDGVSPAAAWPFLAPAHGLVAGRHRRCRRSTSCG